MAEVSESLNQARASLLAERTNDGHWEGELSTSALSTATALVALGSVDPQRFTGEVKAAVKWLVDSQNEDGGWGDTVKSFSNISTTLLCWSALTKFGGEGCGVATRLASNWIRDYVGSLQPSLIAETVKARYGKDRTFSVPILMLCAICGTLGNGGWKYVLQLPFQLAMFPRSWFGLMRLPVVSYALPALIAIGYARFRQGPLGHRRKSRVWPKASRLLAAIQPASGGFLEAAPLTSFVTMALVAAGEKDHPVVKKAAEFLLDTVRPDGSWPIDTNLATWVTTLSIKALLGKAEAKQESWVPDLTLLDQREALLGWLLAQQYKEIHPFTDTPPGGWAWTDLSGGVPDADDTPGALLALKLLEEKDNSDRLRVAAAEGIEWLVGLQNRDGGIPTFCKGWGALPFDRSSPDLTAHTLRAMAVWRDEMSGSLIDEIDRVRKNGLRYLFREQRPDGSWVPLWFGNQHRCNDEENPTYGTAMVLRALDELGVYPEADQGVIWLMDHQNNDGGWGASQNRSPSTIEETALAVGALAWRPEAADAVRRGRQWLIDATQSGTTFDAAPIGFYFARLWYYERVYPIVWTVEAFARSEAAIEY